MAKSYLRRSEKDDLIQFIASRGGGYKKYLVYAHERGWPIYTEAYYHVLCQRKRDKIREARARVHEEIRNVDEYDRKKRLDEYEAMLSMIDELIEDPLKGDLHTCLTCDTLHTSKADTVIRLLEQKRKFLEQIAKERNEWGKETKAEDISRGRQVLRGIAMAQLSEAQETSVSDGKVVVVRNEGSV